MRRARTGCLRLSEPMPDSTRLALRGRTVVVTRPTAQAQMLNRLIDSAGGRVLPCPALELVPVKDVPVKDLANGGLGQLDLAIFVSANAVRFSFESLRSQAPTFRWPESLPVLAVGPATARALEAEGVAGPKVPPLRWDSEGLLDMQELAGVDGKRIGVFKGVGGRNLLGSVLRERGAELEFIECYRRKIPETDIVPVLVALETDTVDAVTVSSMEGLRNLLQLLGEARAESLHTIPLFVPNRRAQEAAAAMGFLDALVGGVADEEVVRALVAYFSAPK